jgi:uroporphyrinogen III methyltransferase/synthase
LIEAFPDRSGAANGRILFPCADQAPATIPDGLEQKGWDVTTVEAYRTVNLPVADAALLGQVARADAVTFTATSSVRAYLDLRTPEGAALPVPAYVVCIGPTTTENARAMGLRGVDTAWGASAAGMVDALVHHFAEDRGDAS